MRVVPSDDSKSILIQGVDDLRHGLRIEFTSTLRLAPDLRASAAAERTRNPELRAAASRSAEETMISSLHRCAWESISSAAPHVVSASTAGARRAAGVVVAAAAAILLHSTSEDRLSVRGRRRDVNPGARSWPRTRSGSCQTGPVEATSGFLGTCRGGCGGFTFGFGAFFSWAEAAAGGGIGRDAAFAAISCFNAAPSPP